jgi:hypothetical protein
MNWAGDYLKRRAEPVDLAQADAFTRMEQALENHLDFIRGQCARVDR